MHGVLDIRKKAQTHDCECICTHDINSYQNNYHLCQLEFGQSTLEILLLFSNFTYHYLITQV